MDRVNPSQEVEDVQTLNMHVTDVTRAPATDEGYIPLVQHTTRGEIECRYYPVPGATGAVIFVGGAGGGFDTPVRGWLYPRLSSELQREEKLAVLRVRYRHAGDLEESVQDVLAGISFLEAEGIQRIGLVGHSFGGAVVIQAAAFSPVVVTCVPMSTQTYGAGPAAALGPRCSLLLVHGTADEILPDACSRQVYRTAREPRKLLLKENVHHGLDEWANELPGILRQWLRDALAPGAGGRDRE